MKRVGSGLLDSRLTSFFVLSAFIAVAVVLAGCEDFQAQAAKLSGNRALAVIITDPSGASVYFNGTFKGTTPRKLTVQEGAYDIQLRKSGYATFDQQYSFSHNHFYFINQTLNPTGTALGGQGLSAGGASGAGGIPVVAATKVYYSREAESGQINAPMGVGTDPAASGDQHQFVSSPQSSAGSVAFSFTIPQSSQGTFTLWSRVSGANANANAFLVSVDGAAPVLARLPQNAASGAWAWSDLGPQGTPLNFTLAAGTHTITIGGGVANAELDRIVLTNDLQFSPETGASPAPNVGANAPTAAAAGGTSNLWVTGYVSCWTYGDMPPAQINFDGLTDVIYFFLVSDSSGNLGTASSCSGQDGYDAGQAVINAAHAHGVRALVSIADQGSEVFPGITTNSDKTNKLADNIVAKVKSMGYDGVELDWEGPTAPGMCNLVHALRTRLDTMTNHYGQKMEIAIAGITTRGNVYSPCINEIDQLNIMSYDMEASSNECPGSQYGTSASAGDLAVTGFLSPLYPPTGFCQRTVSDNVDDSQVLGMHTKYAIPLSKLAIGIPFYAAVLSGYTAPGQITNSGSPWYGQIEHYDNKMKLLNAMASAGMVHRDAGSHQPWAGGNAPVGIAEYTASVSQGQATYVTYDDETSIRDKVQWAKAQGLGGVMIYELWDGWTNTGSVHDPMLRYLVDEVRNGATGPVCGNGNCESGETAASCPADCAAAADTTPPTVSVSESPASPSTTSSVTISATATDASGINTISVSVDGVVAKTCTSSPCATTAKTYAAGSHTYSATAKDASTNQNIASTSTQSFTVGGAATCSAGQCNGASQFCSNGAWANCPTGQTCNAGTCSVPPTLDTTPPAVSATESPASPSTTSLVTVSATATDASGISTIKIFVDGTLVKTCTASPCAITPKTFTSGTHTYYATATDASANLNTAVGSTSNFLVGTVNPPPSGNGTNVIVYENSLATGWSDISWSAQNNLMSTAQTYQGSADAIKSTLAGWGGLEMRYSSTLPLTSQSTFQFAVYASAATPLSIHVHTATDKSAPEVMRTVNAGWNLVSVSLSELNPSNLPITTFWIQNFQGSSATLYFDHISFTTTGGPGPITGGTTVYHNSLATGWSDISWSAQNNLASTTPTYQSSSAAISSALLGWGGVQLRSTSAITPSAGGALSFAVYASASTPLSIHVHTDADKSLPETFRTVNAGWTLVSIPLSTLDPTNTPFDQFWIQNYQGSSATISVDEITIGGSSSGASQVCGNGVREGTETCDLGDASHGNGNGVCPKGCSTTCQMNSCAQLPVCGNGACETGETAASCPADCAAAADTTPPTVSASEAPSSPANSTLVTITATATDASGINTISVTVDGVVAKTCTSSPCTSTAKTYAAGSHTYSATAKDASTNQNQGSSPTQTFTVTTVGGGGGSDVTPPTVTATESPSSPTSTTSVTISATATDASGISSLKIYVDSTLVKTCTSSPCSTTASMYTAGSHTYYAAAVDASASLNSGVSTLSSFTVTAAGGGGGGVVGANGRWFTMYYGSWSQGTNPLGYQDIAIPTDQIEWTGISHLVHFGNSNIDYTTAPYYTLAIPGSTEEVEMHWSASEGCSSLATCNGHDYQKELIDAAHAHGVKVMVTVASVDGLNMRKVLEQGHEQVLANAVAQYVKDHNYDGIEVDWEFWADQPATADEMTRLFTALRNSLNTIAGPGKLISASAGAGHSSYYSPSLDSLIDQYNLQLYDYTGDSKVCPINSVYPKGSCRSISSSGPGQWISAGHSPSKMGIGLATFPRIYKGSASSLSVLGSTISDGNYQPAEFQNSPGHVSDLLAAGGTLSWDDTMKVNYISGKATKTIGTVEWKNPPLVTSGQYFFYTYNTPDSAVAAVNWAKSQGLGGVMIYEMQGDAVWTAPLGQRHPVVTAAANAWWS